MGTSAFVRDDGYTHKAFIEGIYNLYPDVSIEYRMTSLEQRSKLFEWWQSVKPSQKNEVIATAISKKLISWDIEDPDAEGEEKGKIAEITNENILRLSPELFARLRNIVAFMQEGGDPRGDASESDETTDPGEEFLASLQKN